IQLCIKTCDFRQRPLIFVHRGVNYCNAVARAIVALLGRFLPRLGPLANASGLFLAIRPPPDTGAALPAEFRPGAAPASPGRPPTGRTCWSARSGARPCKARG